MGRAVHRGASCLLDYWTRWMGKLCVGDMLVLFLGQFILTVIIAAVGGGRHLAMPKTSLFTSTRLS